MTVPAAVLAQLAEAGCRVTLRPDGRLSLQPPPPPELLALAKQHRDDLVTLLIRTTTPARVEVETAAPAATAPPAPRPTRPGVCLGDPPAPIVNPEATRILCILELAGTQPSLQPDGTLVLAHPERSSSDLRAEARQHQDDIVALLRYRALLEKLWPVEVEPLPPLNRKDPP